MKKISTIAAALASLALPQRAWAAVEVIKQDQLPAALKDGPTVEDLIRNAISILIWVAGIASVIVIVVGGIMLITSSGNPDSTRKAKNAILYAIIGLIIALLAFAIVQAVYGGLTTGIIN